ncbi:MAG: hypothetical protein ACOCSK_00845 [Rhodothermales bacterium]
MEEKPHRLIEYDRLNLLGKAVFAGGTAVRMTAKAIDSVIDRATDVLVEAEKAFRQGADPRIDDAHIIEEDIDPRPRERGRDR